MTGAERRRRDERIVRDYLAGHSQAALAAAHDVTVRRVAGIVQAYGAARKRGRPAAWADCPPALQGEFRALQRYVGAAAARVTIERSMGL